MSVKAAGGRAPEPRAGWSDRLLRWRDRRLADPRFQRWASRFPLTRPLARRHARALFDLCAGFVYSQVLLACVRLRLLEQLRLAPLTQAQLAHSLDLDGAGARALLTAAEALGLIEARPGNRFGLGTLGAALLGNPAVLHMIDHHPLLYEDLRDPVALLRAQSANRQLARLWPYARHREPRELNAAQVGAYTDLMADTQSLLAEDVLDSYPFHRHRCLLDVGGGDGSFLCAVAARVPQLQLMLFDLPAVMQQARVRLQAAGIAARVQLHGGDFALGALPAGADLISLVRVLHDHDDAAALGLLQAIRRGLAPGGTLLVAEPMPGVPGAVPGTEAYFACYLLAMGQGRPRSPARIGQLLRQAGFAAPRLRRTARPWQCAVLTAVAR